MATKKLPAGVELRSGSVLFKRQRGVRAIMTVAIVLLLILTIFAAASSTHPLDAFLAMLFLYLPMMGLPLLSFRAMSVQDIEVFADKMRAGEEVIRFCDIAKVSLGTSLGSRAYTFLNAQGILLSKAPIKGPVDGLTAFRALLQAGLPPNAVMAERREADPPKNPILQCIIGAIALVAGCFLCAPAFAAIPAVRSGGDISSVSSSHFAPLAILGIELALFGLLSVYDVAIWPLRKKCATSETQIWPKDKLGFFDVFYPFVCGRPVASRIVFGYDVQAATRHFHKQRVLSPLSGLGVITFLGICFAGIFLEKPAGATQALVPIGIFMCAFFVMLAVIAAYDLKRLGQLLKVVDRKIVFERSQAFVVTPAGPEEIESVRYVFKQGSYYVRAITASSEYWFAERLLSAKP